MLRLGSTAVGRRVVIAIPYLWLLALFLVPFAIVFKISLSEVAMARPPYTPVLDWAGGVEAIRAAILELDLENYYWILEDDLYWKSYLSSLQIAAVSTLLSLLVAFPFAYGMARAPRRHRTTLVIAVDPSLLDEFPHPRLRMDRHPEEGGACSTSSWSASA